MLIEIPEVLSRDEVGYLNDRLSRCQFVDGRLTAGYQAQRVKNNLELAPSRDMVELARTVHGALARNPVFNQFALPRKLMVPIFSRYEVGTEYGNHSDVSMMHIDQPEAAIRTDIATTVFLSQPEEYDGGSLEISTHAGVQQVKLPAGFAVAYPCHYLHRVEPVTRGHRLAAVTWTQSFVRAEGQREILYELNDTAEVMGREDPDGPEAQSIFNVYHKLMRMWAET